MKNIIAIASLLAAGTALANAETVLTTKLVGTNATPDNESVSATIGTVYSLDSSKAQTATTIAQQTGSNLAGNYIFAPKINIELDSANDSNPVVGYGWTTSLSFSLAEGASWNDVFSELSTVSVDFIAFNAVGYVQKNSFTEQYKLKLTCGSSSWESDWATLAISGTGKTANEYLRMVSLSDVAQTETFTLDSALSSPGNDKIVLDIFVARGSNTNGTYVGVSSVSFGGTTIPEPSAFGLLAGAGALAFVAARRRRRAK